MSFRLSTLCVLAVLSLVCASTSAHAQAGQTPVRVRFAAVVGDAPASCGTKYEGIGTTNSAIAFSDFRFYVSRVRLIKADGSETPVALTQDGLWQVDDVALLDFENGTAACANGTEQTRDVIEGQVSAGSYVGLAFDLGLPFEKNHKEATLQPSPLNLSRLFWSWNAGYKFMRMDIRTTGQPKGWMLHLGSGGCVPTGSPVTVPESCRFPNLPRVTLGTFDPAVDVIELDVKKLLAENDVDANTPKTAVGCMSSQSDPECAALFKQLGLAWGDVKAAPQTFFRVRARATSAAQQ